MSLGFLPTPGPSIHKSDVLPVLTFVREEMEKSKANITKT